MAALVVAIVLVSVTAGLGVLLVLLLPLGAALVASLLVERRVRGRRRSVRVPGRRR